MRFSLLVLLFVSLVSAMQLVTQPKPTMATNILAHLEDELKAAVKLSDFQSVLILSQIQDLSSILNSPELFESAIRSASEMTLFSILSARNQAVLLSDLKLVMECKRGLTVMSHLLFEFNNTKFYGGEKFPRDSISLAAKLEMYDIVRYLLDCHDAKEKVINIEQPVESKSLLLVKFLKCSFEQAIATSDLDTMKLLLTCDCIQSDFHNFLLQAIQLKNSEMIDLLLSTPKLQKLCLDGQAAVLAAELSHDVDMVIRLLDPSQSLSLEKAIIISSRLGEPLLLSFLASFYISPEPRDDLDRFYLCSRTGLHYPVDPLTSHDVHPVRTPASLLNSLIEAALNSKSPAELIAILLGDASVFLQGISFGPMIYAFENAIELTHFNGDIRTRNKVFSSALKYYLVNPILEHYDLGEHCTFLIQALKSAESLSVLGHMLPSEIKRSILNDILDQLIPKHHFLMSFGQ